MFSPGPSSTPEFWPREKRERYAELADRIEDLADALPEWLRLEVVLLPYEVQVSSEAARVAAEAGLRWEEGFLEGTPQQTLGELLDGLHVYDARAAFVGDGRAGQWFVHLDGSALDVNHLDRDGHRALAAWLAHTLFSGEHDVAADDLPGIAR